MNSEKATWRQFKEPLEDPIWYKLGWADLDDGPDRNMDGVSDWLCIESGCPECGSAWIEVQALGFLDSPSHVGDAAQTAWGDWLIEPMRGVHAPMASRLLCWNDHVIEYELFSKKHRVVAVSAWRYAVAMLGGAVAMYAMSGAFVAAVKGKAT
jgi:hypothetical protein